MSWVEFGGPCEKCLYCNASRHKTMGKCGVTGFWVTYRHDGCTMFSEKSSS